MAGTIGILTAGGDSPGLNGAINGIEKAAISNHPWIEMGRDIGLSFGDGRRA